MKHIPIIILTAARLDSADVQEGLNLGADDYVTKPFDRRELSLIMGLYGRYVAEGEWRDYAIDFAKDVATFAIHRHASEQPLYRIQKTPALSLKQGLYSVVAPGGLVMKRGNDLELVLRVLLKKPKLVNA